MKERINKMPNHISNQNLDPQTYLAAIIESSDDAIISKNLDGIITSWNAAAVRMFGYQPEEAIGQHISLIIPTARRDEEFIIIGKVKSGVRVDHFETVRIAKDGSLLDISLTVSPIRSHEGEIIGASKIARDVTEQNRIKQALRETNARKDEFLTNMSHELRTPMNAIIGLAHILGMSQSLTRKEKEFVSTLRQSADNLMVLINNLLDFSKMDMGSLELESAEFSLPEVIKNSTDLLNFTAREKGLSLNIIYGPGVKKYYIGDPFRLQQILTNLVSNAIKFTEKGKIEITITHETESDSESTLVIAVADTGIGIAEDKLDAIFDKFIQADASITRKYGGTGLGLAIARGFIEKMNGNLHVSSRLGLGSTFTITVPLQNSNRLAEIEAQINESTKTHKNILIVDDYQPNILVVATMIEQMGYDYDIAETGIEAVREFQDNQYDVILMDVQMHGMDGYESTRRIRMIEHDKNLKPTPIIAMTAHVRDADRERCLEVGMNDFIPKPFDYDIFSQKLKDIIRRKKIG